MLYDYHNERILVPFSRNEGRKVHGIRPTCEIRFILRVVDLSLLSLHLTQVLVVAALEYYKVAHNDIDPESAK